MKKTIPVILAVTLLGSITFYGFSKLDIATTSLKTSMASAAAVLGLGTPTNGQPLKIGAVLTLTGDYGVIGDDINRGALLAIDDAKKSGVNVEYVSEDDGFNVANAVSAAMKLLTVDKVDAVMATWVTTVKPLAPLFNKSKVPLLSAWDNTSFMKQAGPYVFTVGFSAEGNGKLMADFAFDTLKLRKVAVLYQTEEWSGTISQAFMSEFESRGGEVAVSNESTLDDTDFKTVIAEIKQANVDGVYFPLNVPANGIFLIQAQQLGLHTTMMTGDAFIQDEIDAARSAADGVYFTNIYADNTANLSQEYKAKYGAEPTSAAVVAFGYDGINTIIAAANIAKEKNIPLRDALTMVHIDGAGSPIDMGGKQYADRVEKIYRVANDVPVEVKQ